MRRKDRRPLSAILSGAGECLASGMTASEAAVLVDPDDCASLEPKTRTSIETTLASDVLVTQLPVVLAAAVGPRCEAWVRSLPDTQLQGEVLSLFADELWRPRRVSAVFTLIAADLVVLSVVSFVFAFYVAPTWIELMRSFDAELPVPTRIAIGLGQVITVLVVLGAATFAAMRLSVRLRPSGALTAMVDRAVRRLPVASQVLRLRQSVGLARWLAVGEPEPVSLVRAMAEVGSPMSLGPAARQLESHLGHGVRLSEAMNRAGSFLPGLSKIVRSLEDGGDPPAWRALLTQYVAATAGREGPALDRLLLAAHFVTAIIVAIFVLGLYIPIFKMGSVI